MKHFTKHKQCADCQTPITDTSTYCVPCAAKRHWQKIHPPFFKNCAECGNPFQVAPARSKKRTFCSVECYQRNVKRNAKGSIDQGYVRVVVDGKRKQLHRHETELRLGRTLRPDEHVHHVNENPLDNRPENLEVLDISDHISLHHKGKHPSAEARRKMSESAKRRKDKRQDTNS